MVLAVILGTGTLIAWLLGSDLAKLARVRLRATWSVFLALALQIVLFTRIWALLPLHLAKPPVHIASYVLLLVFVAANLRQPGLAVAAIGFALNAIAIAANRGRMPISPGSWRAIGAPASQLSPEGTDNNVVVAAHAHLRWLGDVFPLPKLIPFANALSIGDLLLLVGVTAFVYRAGATDEDRHRRRSVEALGHAAFRRLLIGRTVSKLGDWLTLAAVVTWIYVQTRSTLLVSVFLVLRMTATVAGGLVAAPLLDRFARFRTLWFVEILRGGLMLTALPFAADGNALGVIVIVALSAAVSAASDPSASSIIPDLLPARLVHAGNAAHGVSRNVVMIAGALAGGIAVAKLGISHALLIDIGTFAVAGLLFGRLAAKGLPPRSDPSPVSRVAVLGVLARHRLLFGLVASFTLATLAMAVLNASLPAFLAHRLHDIHAYGYAMAAIGVGQLCGEALSSCVRRESVARRSIAVGFLLCAMTVVLLAATSSTPTAYLFLILLGASDGTTEVVYDTLFQSHLPSAMLGAAFSVAAAIQRTGMIVGFVLAPVLLLAGWRTALDATAGACVAAALVGAIGLIPRCTSSGHGYLEASAGNDPEPGAARVVLPGNDISLITWGDGLATALAAASRLRTTGVSVEVLCPGTPMQWDKRAVLDTTHKTSKVLIAGNSGLDLQIAATLVEEAFYDLDAPIRRLPDPTVDELTTALRELAEH
jgi:predicted MFS family arabinose efflux permease